MKNIIFLILIFISGCAIGPRYVPAAPPPDGKALVYLLQTNTIQGDAYPTVFSVNEVKLVSLYDSGYSYVYLPPGTYLFKTNVALWGSKELQITVPIESGKEYYLEHTEEMESYPRYNTIFRKISKVNASKIISEYRYNEI